MQNNFEFFRKRYIELVDILTQLKEEDRLNNEEWAWSFWVNAKGKKPLKQGLYPDDFAALYDVFGDGGNISKNGVHVFGVNYPQPLPKSEMWDIFVGLELEYYDYMYTKGKEEQTVVVGHVLPPTSVFSYDLSKTSPILWDADNNEWSSVDELLSCYLKDTNEESWRPPSKELAKWVSQSPVKNRQKYRGKVVRH